MSDAMPFPEDLSRWPDDPWQMLGISRQAERREVRRAYARLIRIYKPEHKPAEFRLIRDAFERIDAFLEFHAARDKEMPAPSGCGASAGVPSDAADASYAIVFPGRASAAHHAQDARETEIDRFWRQAGSSPDELAATYRAYRAMFEKPQADEELCVRLYWLLRLWPHLDGAVRCCDCLVQGMTGQGAGGRLLELYRREIQRDPEKALSDRLMDVVKLSPSAQHRVELLAIRWQAASFLNRRSLIPRDLDWARTAFGAENPEVWARLLLSAMDHLAWESAGPLADLYHACRSEVTACSSEHLHLEYELDRGDFLGELAASWLKMQRSGALPSRFLRPVADMIEDSWTQPFHRIRVPLLNLLTSWLAAPIETMNSLDDLGRVAPLIIHRIFTVVDALWRDRCDPEQLAEAPSSQVDVKNFLWLARRAHYEESRCRALAFCLHHRVTAEIFVEAVDEVMSQTAELSSDLPRYVQNDLVLRLLAKAALACWPEFDDGQGPS